MAFAHPRHGSVCLVLSFLLASCSGSRNDGLRTNNINSADGAVVVDEDDAAPPDDDDAARPAAPEAGQDSGLVPVDSTDAASDAGSAAAEAEIFPEAGEILDIADAAQDAQIDVMELPRCGNGQLDSEEECDHGDANSNTLADACRTNCRNARCGDGVVDQREQCDQGEANSDSAADACRTSCKSASCGDGVVDKGEACDSGDARSDTAPGACRLSCVLAHCGDAVRDGNEACDDGNKVDTDACRNDCTSPHCGDHVIDIGEECDDGNLKDGDGCQKTCRLPICGDGVVDPGEECDDHNTSNNDGCRSNCKRGCVADAACSDGKFCNGVERCLDGLCQPASAGPELNDGIGCTIDSCDEASAQVVHQPSDARCQAPAPTCSTGTGTSSSATCDVARGGCVVRTTTQACSDSPSVCVANGDGNITLTTYAPACNPNNMSCGPATPSSQVCTFASASCSVGRVHTGVAAATCNATSEQCGRRAPTVTDCSAADRASCAADNTSFTRVTGTCDAQKGCGSSTATSACSDPPDSCTNGRRQTFAPSCTSANGCGAPVTTSDQICDTTATACVPSGANRAPAVQRYSPACDPNKPGACLAGGAPLAPEYCGASPSTCNNTSTRIPTVTKYSAACAADGVSCVAGGVAKTENCAADTGTTCGPTGPKGEYQETRHVPACNSDKSDCVQGGAPVATNCAPFASQTACTIVGDFATRVTVSAGCEGNACAPNGITTLTQCRNLPVTCSGTSERRPANKCEGTADCVFNTNACVKGNTSTARPTINRCETRVQTGTCADGTGCEYTVSNSLDCNSYCGALPNQTGSFICSSAYCAINADNAFSCQPLDTTTCQPCANGNFCLGNRCIPRIVVGPLGGGVLNPGAGI